MCLEGVPGGVCRAQREQGVHRGDAHRLLRNKEDAVLGLLRNYVMTPGEERETVGKGWTKTGGTQRDC